MRAANRSKRDLSAGDNMRAKAVFPGYFITLCLLSFFSVSPLSAEPLGAGAFSGVVNLLAFILPLSVLLLSIFPHIFLHRCLKRGVEVAAGKTVWLFAIGICLVFSALTAGAVVLTIDLATPKEIYTGDGFTKTDIAWGFVISAALSGFLACSPVLQSVRLLRVLGTKR